MADSSSASTTASLSPQRSSVSAFVITFNEESDIRACLESLSFCDEVIVVDSYSTDSTVSIAEGLSARVLTRAWPGYRAQKEFGLAATSHEWVINIDADERISPELRENILEVLRADYRRKSSPDAKPIDPKQEVIGYYVSRVVYFLGRWWRKGGWYPEYRLRFFRKGFVEWGGADPHEKAIPKGRTARISGEILHFTYKSLSDQYERLHSHSTAAAREEFKSGRVVGLKSLLFRPLNRMFKFYILKGGYREGVAGIIVAVAEGYYTFMKYAKVWELQHTQLSDVSKPSDPDRSVNAN